MSTGGSATGPVSLAPAASLEIPKEVLATILQLPFAVAAAKTKWSGFALDDEDTSSLVPLAQQAARELLPVYAGPYAASLALAGSLAMLATVRYLGYVNRDRDGTGPRATPSRPPESVL